MPMSPRLLRPRAAGGFDPRAIANLGLWLDASDSSSYTVATGVSEWRDKSGGSRHFAQTTANNQPATSTMNGRPAFSFDGSNDTLSGNEAARDLFRNTPGATLIVVYETAASPGSNVIFGSTTPGNATRQNFNFQTATGQTRYVFGGRRLDADSLLNADDATKNVIIQGAASICAYLIDHSSANVSVRHNGVQQFSLAWQTAGNSSDTRSASVTVGSLFANFFNGKIAAVLYYQRALTSSEIAPLERWLGSQWGITVA